MACINVKLTRIGGGTKVTLLPVCGTSFGLIVLYDNQGRQLRDNQGRILIVRRNN